MADEVDYVTHKRRDIWQAVSAKAPGTLIEGGRTSK